MDINETIVLERTPDQLQELIEWRQERSNFWTGFAKQTKNIGLQIRRLANANEHAKQATILRGELNGWN